MTKLILQHATLNDIEMLQYIGRKTFYETFVSGNTEEDLKKYLEEGFSIESLTKQLEQENSEFYLCLE